ncbi:MAG: hypothetical protein NUW01_18580 [Gemmatimonadaceae bacterium]|nr:hypothetical protein [Gemmatimonadaceae bacterium]
MALAPEEVGKRIEEARKAAGYAGHQDFADAVSERLERRVNLRTVQRWQKGRDPKTGKSWLPRLGTLMEIADLLGVSRSYFVEDEAEQPPDSELHSLREEVAEVKGMLSVLLERGKPKAPARRSRRASG